jgi:transcriptional regulator with XRE-family HTH domain
MTVSNKIKAMLKLKGRKTTDLAKYLGLSSSHALSNKFARGSFTAEDLIKIADFLGCEIAFIFDDHQKFRLDMGDIRTKPSVENEKDES